MRFGSLFAGIGGFDLGLERAGMECAWQVEIDPWAQKVLAKHWPDVRRYGDICEVNYPEPVEVLCGGFPCQDISGAGKGAGITGSRSGLWKEYKRIIREVGPRWVIIENVSILRSRGLVTVLQDLSEIGYDAEWHCVPASYVGAPHRRDRIWIVAYPNQQGLEGSGPQRILQGRQTTTGHTGQGSAGGQTTHWAVEPNVGRVANGVPKRVDRLRGLGNAVVPQVVEFIGNQIMRANLDTN